DLYGKSGHPVRATASDMGPLLLGRMLGLNETQESVLSLVFKIADDEGLLLLDLKDLRAMLQHVGDNAAQYKTEYGNVSTASVGAIQRGLLALENQGAAQFFGEPMLDIADLMQANGDKGVVNVLAADKLMSSPKLYSTFLLWLLAELFEHLPEVGDVEKPKLVFFFDEAHLLFAEAPKALLEKVEQVVRLIRSKGVGVYFVTQNPLDVPESVLGQLGNRVQHALRAFTPKDQKAVKTAADTLRPNPKIKAEQVITELGVGEALISFLDEKGTPCVVERAFIVPPGSQLGPISDAQRQKIIQSSDVFGHYEKAIDRESAYEKLKGRTEEKLEPVKPSAKPAGRQPQSMVEAMAKSAARSIGSELGRQLLRGILGSIGGKRR
ncbi:MAG TPA: helicase HerA-like domain-containing protein, partial [Burkholderiales bacterium]|nr:helicase HerA-like domain-containing protein [Burkholderiales bacterium]